MTKRRGLEARLRDTFTPFGFIPISNRIVSRQLGSQLQLVELQYRRGSDEITFNLGCHFLGVPSLLDFHKTVTKENIEDLDCGLRARVGAYIGNGELDVWWSPANSDVQATLSQASWAADRAFTDCINRWEDGAPILESYIKVKSKTVTIKPPLFRWMLVHSEFDRIAFLALLAKHLRRFNSIAPLLRQAVLYRDLYGQRLAALEGAIGTI